MSASEVVIDMETSLMPDNIVCMILNWLLAVNVYLTNVSMSLILICNKIYCVYMCH